MIEKLAPAPLIVTDVACAKLVPPMARLVPLVPEPGETEVMFGVASGV